MKKKKAETEAMICPTCGVRMPGTWGRCPTCGYFWPSNNLPGTGGKIRTRRSAPA